MSETPHLHGSLRKSWFTLSWRSVRKPLDHPLQEPESSWSADISLISAPSLVQLSLARSSRASVPLPECLRTPAPLDQVVLALRASPLWLRLKH